MFQRISRPFPLLVAVAFAAALAIGCGPDAPAPARTPLIAMLPAEATAFVSIDWRAVGDVRDDLASRLGADAVADLDTALTDALAEALGTRADLAPFFSGFARRTARWFDGETAAALLPEPVLMLSHRNRTEAEGRMSALVFFANTQLKHALEDLEPSNAFGLDPERGRTLAGWLGFFDPTFLRKRIDGREVRVLKLPDGPELCWIATDRAVVLGVGTARTLRAVGRLEAAAALRKGDAGATTEDTGAGTLFCAFMDADTASGGSDAAVTRAALQHIVGQDVEGSSTEPLVLTSERAAAADVSELEAVAAYAGRLADLLKHRIGRETY